MEPGGVPAAPSSARAVSRPSLHIPGFDGLRGVALLAVLCFHQSFTWARGGFLGVSTFFTLSGFLIGRITFLEVARSGRLDVGRFWVRRVRRLVPAALLTLVVVAALSRLVDLGPLDQIRGDLLAALAWSANWRFVAAGSGYQTSFAAPSPVQHFWSLAIEEQFYLVFPLLTLGVAALWGRRWALVSGAFAALAALGFGLAYVVADGNHATAYYATHTRAAELVVGVAFAAFSMTPAFARTLRRHAGPVAAAGILGLVGLVALAGTQTASSPELFRGVTALNALCTVCVIAACVVRGPVSSVLSQAPLRFLGRVSYGAYLYHWPVYLVLAPPRVDLAPWPSFGLRLVVTFALAAASALFMEEPIRFGRKLPPLRVAVALAAAIAAVAGVLVVRTGERAPRPTDRVALPTKTMHVGNMVVAPPRAPARHAAPPVRILLAGDSVAYTTVPGFEQWNLEHPLTPVALDGAINFGCPVHGNSPIRLMKQELNLFPECIHQPEGLAADVAAKAPQVVVFLSVLADLGETGMVGRWRHLGDPMVDDLVRSRYEELVEAVHGVPLVLVVPPPVSPRDQPPTIPPPPYREADPARYARLQEIIREVAAAHPAEVHLVDMGAWCQARLDGCLSRDFRPDGVHFSQLGSDETARWLVAQVMALTHR
jgi:peptidoglycan/LPS O-acetylase OafA/YrhL